MAESWRAKANRYSRGDCTKSELLAATGVLLADQIIDIATFGTLSKLKGKALQKAVLPLLKKTVTRGVLPAAASVARTGLGASRLVMTNPYLLGATAIYVGVTERERIAELLNQGYEITRSEIVPGPEEYFMERLPGRQAERDYSGGRSFGVLPTQTTKKRPSTFNKAVSAGMKAVKKSTSYGGKGKIKPAKKAFSCVTKMAAAKKKKKKAPKSGIRRVIWNAMRGYK